MVEVKGTIKVIAKTGGIVLTSDEKKWYNPDKSVTWKDDIIAAKDVLRGKEVVLTLNDAGYVMEFKADPGETPPAEFSPGVTEEKIDVGPRKYQGVTVGMAINNAANLLNSNHDYWSGEMEPEDWAKDIVVYAKALLEEMEKEGL